MTLSIAKCLDAVIDGARAAERIVGTVVLLSHDGERIYARAAGFADREAGTPMREDAIFRLAPVSKLFTATAALAFVERGTLDLDRPVTDWLPNFAPRFESRPAAITLRQLLSDSTGLGYGFLEQEDGPLHRAGVSDGMDRSTLTLAENVRRIATAPLLFAPGTGFSDADFAPLLEAEVDRAKALYTDGFIRQIWHRAYVGGACLLIEAESEEAVREMLATLPLVGAGMLEIVALVPLKPYGGFGPGR